MTQSMLKGIEDVEGLLVCLTRANKIRIGRTTGTNKLQRYRQFFNQK